VLGVHMIKKSNSNNDEKRATISNQISFEK